MFGASTFGGGSTSFGGGNTSFGQTNTQQQRPAFGAATTGQFGNTSTGSLGGFGGNTANRGGMFGQQQGGMFGQQQGGNSFSSNLPGSTPAFGQRQNAQTGSNVFGGATISSSKDDFKPIKEPTRGRFNFMSITAAPQYQNLSFEELRMQDTRGGGQLGGGGNTLQVPNATGGMFGATPQANTTGQFGQTSAFGGGNTSFGGSSTFGGQQQQKSAFGQTNTAFGGGSSAFGGGSTTFGGGGMLGGQQQKPTGFGGNTSFGGGNTGGMFGQQNNALGGNGAFGQQTNSAFGQQGAFGQQAKPSGFGGGSLGSTAFGGGANTSFGGSGGLGGLGGQSTFGQTGGQSAFGQTNTSFGAKPGGLTSAFGAKPGGFGQQTNTSFGQQKPGGFGGGLAGGLGGNTSFGQTNTSFGAKPGGFGQQTNTSFGGGGLGGGLGGQKPSMFGSGATGGLGGGLGGNTSFGGGLGGGLAKPGGLSLGKPATGGSMFGGGNTSFGGGNTSFSLGGNTGANKSLLGGGGGTSMFGGGLNKPATGSMFGGGGQATTSLFGNKGTTGLTNQFMQPNQMNAQQQIQNGAAVATVDSNPYMLSHVSSGQQNVLKHAVGLRERDAIKKDSNTESVAPRSSARVRNRRYGPRGLGAVAMGMKSPGFDSSLSMDSRLTPQFDLLTGDMLQSRGLFKNWRPPAPVALELSPTKKPSVDGDDEDKLKSPAEQRSESKYGTPSPSAKKKAAEEKKREVSGKWKGVAKSMMGAVREAKAMQEAEELAEADSAAAEPNPNAPVIQDIDAMFTNPSIDTLCTFSDEELANVKDFTIIHKRYGQITWFGLTDVRGLIIDEVVQFGNGAVEVYPNDMNVAPGEGLNKEATVQLKHVWPRNKQTHERVKPTLDTDMDKWVAKLRKRKFTTFIDFDTENGNWTFRMFGDNA